MTEDSDDIISGVSGLDAMFGCATPMLHFWR
jgi:hypothetical protein